MEQEKTFICTVGIDFEELAATKIFKRCRAILHKKEFAPNSTLVVDMTETEHFDAKGISTLIDIQKDTYQKSGKIILICSLRVHLALTLTFRDDKISEVFPTILRGSPLKAIILDDGRLMFWKPTKDKRIYSTSHPETLSILHNL